MDELERAVGHPLPEGDFETVSGLVISELGELPEAGQQVRIELPDDPRDLSLDEPVHRDLVVEVTQIQRHVPSELVARLEEVSGPRPAPDEDPGLSADRDQPAATDQDGGAR